MVGSVFETDSFAEVFAALSAPLETATIFLLGVAAGTGAVWIGGTRRRRRQRAGLIDCLDRVLHCTEQLNADVDWHNDKLADLGDSLADLHDDQALSPAGRQLAAKIESVIQSNRQLEAELHRTQHELRRRAAELDTSRSEARRDWLSGIANRRAFQEMAEHALTHPSAGTRSLGLLLVDVDHFKRVNDTWGHRAGDRVLEQLGRMLQAIVGDDGIAARLGGDEFGILLVRGKSPAFIEKAEEIRHACEQASFTVASPAEPLSLTVSVGLTTARPGDSLESWMDRGDSMLYSAKRAGRNRVGVDESIDSATATPVSANSSPR